MVAKATVTEEYSASVMLEIQSAVNIGSLQKKAEYHEMQQVFLPSKDHLRAA